MATTPPLPSGFSFADQPEAGKPDAPPPLPSGFSFADDKSQAPPEPVAAQPAAPASLPPGTPAGASGPLPGLPAHPAVDMQPENLTTAILHPDAPAPGAKPQTLDQATRDAFAHGGLAPERDALTTGVKDLAGAAKADFERSGGNPFVGKTTGDIHRQAMQGASETIGAAGDLAFKLDGESILQTGIKAVGGDLAAKVAIAKLAAGFGIGAGAAEVSGKVADHYNASPEAKGLVQALAFFVPSLAGLAGIHADVVDGAQGKGVAATIGAKTDPVTGKPVGGVQFAAGVSPEGVKGVGVKVGDGPMRGINYGNTAPPDGAAATATNLLHQGISTAVDAARVEAAAHAIVGGATPEQAVAAQQPKAPPTPADQAAAQMFPDAVLKPEHMEAAAQIIRSLPPDQQGPATLQAHDQLAQQIGKWGTFQGPDGKLYTVKNPQDAVKFASQFINDKVAEHEAAATAQQKAAEKQAADAQKAASKPAKEGEPQADPLFARAKTLLDANPENQKQSLLQRNLGIGFGKANELLEQYRTEKSSVGSKAEQVVEERPETIDAQMQALSKGTIKAVMLPEGSSYEPKLETGMKKVVVKGDVPGAGTYIIKGITPQTVQEAAKAGTHGDLLGHVQTKEELAGTPTAAVVARKVDGTEVQASEVNNPDAAQRQAEVLQERHPDAHVALEPTEALVRGRMADVPPELPAGYSFAEAQTSGEVHTTDAEPHHSVDATQKVEAEKKSSDVAAGTPKSDKGAEDSTIKVGDRLKGHDGAETSVLTPSGKHEGRYRLVEARDLIASHDAKTFKPNPKYPKGVQERDYDGNADAKHRVISQSQNIEPKYLVNSNPDAVNGPPIVTPDGIVLGGNSRTMTVQRHYDSKGPATYHAALSKQAKEFGFTSDQVERMGNPILVREIAHPGSLEAMERIGSALNKSQMGALSPEEKAISTGRKITGETMDEISRLIDQTGETASVRDMMREHGLKALELLEKSGALTERDAQQYRDSSGVLSEAGKDFIENALLGKIVDDLELYRSTPKAILNKLDGSLAAITSLSSHDDGYDLIGALRSALEQHAEIASRKTNVEAFQNQGGLLSQRDVNPVVDAIARKLAEKPNEVKKALRGFAAEAKDARRGQGNLLGAGADAFESFNHQFGATLTAEEYTHGLARGVSEAEPRRAASQAEQGAAGVQAGRSERSPAEGEGSSDRGDGGAVATQDAAPPAHAEPVKEIPPPVAPKAPLGEETASPSDPTGPFTPKKEDRIRYRAKDGTEKVGRYKGTFGANLTRVAPDGGGKPDIISPKNILGPASEDVPKQEVAAAKPAAIETKPGAVAVTETLPALPKGLIIKSSTGRLEPNRGGIGADNPKVSWEHTGIDGVTVKKTDEGFTAFASDGQVLASGATTTEAFQRALAAKQEVAAGKPAETPAKPESPLVPKSGTKPEPTYQTGPHLHPMTHPGAKVTLERLRHDGYSAKVEDLHGKPTGWKQHNDTLKNVISLVHPTEDHLLQFRPNDPKSGTDLQRAAAEAHAYAIDHPVVEQARAAAIAHNERLAATKKDVDEKTRTMVEDNRKQQARRDGELEAAQKRADQPYDMALYDALTGTAGDSDKWIEARTTGLSNLKMIEAVARAMGAARESSGRYGSKEGFATRGAKFWYGDHPNTREKPTLSGPALIKEARRMLDIGLPKAPEVQQPAEVETKPAAVAPTEKKGGTLTEHLYSEIKAGRMPKDNPALQRLVAGFDKVKMAANVHPSRMKEAQEALEAAIVHVARDIVAIGEGHASDRQTFDRLLKLYESQPNLNIRTSTSVANQAYSTPAPLAYLAGKLAGITGSTTVYEPTAGNGMLVIGADPKTLRVNELNPERAAALKAQGLTVTTDDATGPLPKGVEPGSMDAVITNPPFGSLKDEAGNTRKDTSFDGYKIGQLDHLIAARALEAMKVDGKATLILGASKVSGGQNKDDRIFFNWLYSHYNVSSHFEVEGDLYQRQGAGWPVRVITVDGRVRSASFAPEVGGIERVSTWKDVYEQFSNALAAQPAVSPGRPDTGLDANGVRQPQAGAERSLSGNRDDARKLPAAAAKPARGADRSGSGSSAAVAHGQPGDQPRPLPSGEVESAAGLARTNDDVRPDADASRSDQLPQGADAKPPAKRDERSASPDRSDLKKKGDELANPDNAFQVKYTPSSAKKDEGVLIPTNMRSPLEHAMNTLKDAVGDIDTYAAKELGYKDTDELHDALMGLQVDSVAAAIHQMGQGKAVVIADQTGIGKGRQAAAIIRWAAANEKIPVFMTVKPQLFTDMFGDLADIGTDSIKPFIVNTEESIALPNGTTVFGNKASQHTKNLERVRDTGALPDGRNAIFLTYSQINNPNLKRQLLSSIAHKAVLILDEAHTAAGDSQTGEFMQDLVKQASGVTYLSATFAKRPDNLPLYAKTDIGIAIRDKTKLQEAMDKGGLPLQTVISNNLVKAGQMFRRERSYDGVTITEKTDTGRKAEHTELADKVTTALRAIVKADKQFHKNFFKAQKEQAEKAAKSAKAAGNKISATITHTEFASTSHNAVRQLLLSLKADSAADEAIAALKRGEKPLIAVEQTMGSFLQAYVEANGLKDGDELGDFTYRNVLHRALEQSRYITYQDERGNETKKHIPLQSLDEETLAHYRRAADIIGSVKVDLPVSPIDWMRQRLANAGYSIGEITGRDLAVDYSDPQNPKLSRVPASEQGTANKVETTRRFNSGKLDSVLLNVSGSTGISLHASEKFADQRKRHMIVAQPAQDINVFMQMLGRIHRTGQVRLPEYTILGTALPAEKRPNALLSKKMKSLNANTSSNTESATSVKAADILNKYGDEIVGKYLDDNPELEQILGVKGLTENVPTPDIARQATGKLALLPVARQEAFYNDVEQQYNDYIEYLNATNQNDLEPRTFDYEAKEEASQTFSKGTDQSTPFGQDSTYGEYSIKAQGKPLTPKEVTETIQKNLGGKTGIAHANDLLASLKEGLAKYKAETTSVPQAVHADLVQEVASNFVRNHMIGHTLRMEINGDTFNAAVVNIENKHAGTGNPYSLSKFQVTLATTGPLPNMKIPATNLVKQEVSPLHTSPASLFEIRNVTGREQAKIVTGNLLAAYGEMKDAKGTIINFTKADGSTEMGILLPKQFDLATNTMGDRLLETPEHVVKLLSEGSKDAAQIGVADRAGDVRINRRDGSLIVSVPKSKARGAKFYLDKKILAATGDFVSKGDLMQAVIPRGKEVEAVAAIQNKATLYVPKSMAEEADRLEPKAGEKPKPLSGPVFRSSLLGVDLLAEAIGRTVKVAWDKDVAPHLPELGANIKEASLNVAHTLVPTYGVNPDVLDSMMRLKGDQERSRFALEQVFKGAAGMFDALPESERIHFLDDYKTGQAQRSPELDKLATLYKATDTATYKQIVSSRVGAMDRSYRKVWDGMTGQERDDFFAKVMGGVPAFELPNDKADAANGDKDARKRIRLQTIADSVLTFKENHFRSFWKVIPGTGVEKTHRPGTKAPLRGDRGFMKRSTLPDVSTGMAMGGVLETTNPQKLFEMAQASSLRYITAQNMWKEMGDLGMRKFVKFGERAPDGWEKINDAIAKVYFPAASGEGSIQAGEWYVAQDAARLLNNYLSKDWFKTNAIGRGLLFAKNLTTAVELSFSPFHLMFEGIEAMGSQFGLGAMKAWNVGLGDLNGKAFLDGIKQMGASPAAPVTMSRLGGSALRTEQNLKQFAATDRGKAFLTAFPNAPHLIDLYFTGGGTMGMPAEYRINTYDSLKSALTDKNYLGALARAVPAVAQQIMVPLFEHYIPRLKLGFFLQGISQQLAEKHDALIRGDVSEAQIAREVVNATENRFGELNFSNLWWNNTTKGAMQVAFRSVTWKLGNWRGATLGVAGQAKAFADPLKAMRDDVKGHRKGFNRKPGDYAPKLDLNMSWLVGMAVTTAIIGTIASKLASGKYPWEYLDEDEGTGKSGIGALALEMMHPRTGGEDSYTGLPTRLSLPTGLKDFEHAAEDPRGYLRGSESGFIGKTIDTWDNKDFFGNYVYDPNGSMYQKLADILSYNAPLPITLQQFRDGSKSGDYSKSKLGLLGMSKASGTLDMTPLQKHMQAIERSKHRPQTPEGRQEYLTKMQMIRSGEITGKEARQANKQFDKSYNERMFQKLNYAEAVKAYSLANDDEKAELRGALARKRKAALARSPTMTRKLEEEVAAD